MRLITIFLTYCFYYTTADTFAGDRPQQPICNDSCQSANDGKCDDATIYGGGDCPRGTDCTDCCGGDPLCPTLGVLDNFYDDFFQTTDVLLFELDDFPESTAPVEATSESAPEAASEVMFEGVASAVPVATSESAQHEAAPETKPESAPEAMPESAPEAMPESALAMPESAPEAMPVSAPETILEIQPDSIPKSAPNTIPEKIYPDTIPESPPEIILLPESSATFVCEDTCIFAMDGVCDDGRYGSPAFCQPGTDCQDCGPADAASLMDDYFVEAYTYDEPDGYFDENDSRQQPDSDEDTLFEGLTARTFDQLVNEMAMPAIDIEIVVEEDDEYEIVVEDDSYPDHRPRWAWFAIFFLGMAGGCFGFVLSHACTLGFRHAARLLTLRRADTSAAIKSASGQRRHHDIASNTMPLLV